MTTIVVRFDDELRGLRQQLADGPERLVFVESCTAGMAAGLLGQIPGISQYFCGSLVVYRNDSKHQWLGIDRQILNDPQVGPVSEIVTRQLAEAALRITPEATLAAAITGHLGPDAPAGLDGLVFVSIARAHADSSVSYEYRLAAPPPRDQDDFVARQARQIEAAHRLIGDVRAFLNG